MSAARPAHPMGDEPHARSLASSLVDRLTDPVLRDLAWLLDSADLLRAQPAMPLARPWSDDAEAAQVAAWLVQLDHDPSRLQRLHAALESARVTRLGRYAETLLGWYLENGPALRLVAANIALRGEGRTIGECDFLLETPDGTRVHWELAVKCFLHAGAAHESASRLADYVGPNLRDRLDLKFAHLRDHQLRLSERPELASLGFAGQWCAQMYIKGWLFYRAGTQVADAPELAREHGRGWWVTHADWSAFAERSDADGWSVLPRLAWLAPRRIESRPAASFATNSQFSAAQQSDGDAVPESMSAHLARMEIQAPADAATLFANLERAHEPVMVVAFTADGAGGYVEHSRGFIVPDDWPERALAYARS
ncbi:MULTISPECIES: DUF1853 family protein [unclassified Paraburkholderia]|uniref:DUF1853 family protein n=1 Tax=unclassified Paraburkholderia TaxID=2615204 RepID=UPI002AB26FD7|nr:MULTISPECIES: DUF1853 family protein [unclassified Paraburkholderia]